MDDMQTFERRVATEVVRGMGPSEPVDDAAIFTAITATQSPQWSFGSMFSATKFVVAGAIVALFGGFLLAGALTTQPSEEGVPAVGASASASPEPTPVVTDVYDVGGYIDSLVGSDEAIWIAGDGLVRRIDTQTREVSEVAPRESSSRHLVTTDDAVWASGEDGLLRIEPSTGAVTESYPSLDSWRPPLEAEGSLWMSGDGTLYEVDLESRELVGEYRSPHVGGWIGSGDGELWLWGDGVLARFDLDGREFEGVFPLPSSPWNGSTYEEIHLVSDDAIWMTGEPSGQVLRFDLASRETSDILDLPSDQLYPVVGIDTGDAVWIPSWDVVYRIDRQSRQITDEIEVGGSQANPVAVLADGALWVATRDPGAVHRIDLESRQVTHAVSVGGEPFALAASDGDIWVAGGRGIVTRISTGATDAQEAPEPSPISDPLDLEETATPELLPGVDLVTQEVEPGVYRVLSDDAGHDLVAEPPAGVTLAPDGSVWLLRGAPTQDEAELLGRGPRDEVDALYRLGREGMYVFELSQPSHESRIDVAVDTDGVAWVSMGSDPRDEGTLASHDGTTWSSPTWPDGSAAVGAIEATTDGTVWVAREVQDGPGPTVARVLDGEWTSLPPLDDPSLEGLYRGPHASFVAAEDGTAWFANGRMTSGGSEGPGPTGLLRFDGEQWAVVDLPIDGTVLHAGPLALGPEGTLWVYVADHSVISRPTNHLARLDADGWTVFSGRSSSFGHTLREADGVPMLSTPFYYEARMAVGPDGKLWIAVGGDGGMGDPNWLYPPSLDPAPGPVGLLTFDGTTWHQYLKGLHVNRVDIADDGTVYAAALYGCPIDTDCDPWTEDGGADWSRGGLYVITPEAVQ